MNNRRVTRSYQFQLPSQLSMVKWASILLIALLTACGQQPAPPKTVSLDLPTGSAEAGEQAFVDLECIACHTVSGIDLPSPEEIFEVSVVLAEKKSSISSNSDLLIAIIDPSHEFIPGYPESAIQQNGQSKMPVYNDVMTVTQLMDIIAFLGVQYGLPSSGLGTPENALQSSY